MILKRQDLNYRHVVVSHLTKVEQQGMCYSSSYAWCGLHRAAKAA